MSVDKLTAIFIFNAARKTCQNAYFLRILNCVYTKRRKVKACHGNATGQLQCTIESVVGRFIGR